MTIDQYKDKCEELIVKRLISLSEKIVNQEDLSENDLIWLYLMNIHYFENMFEKTGEKNED